MNNRPYQAPAIVSSEQDPACRHLIQRVIAGDLDAWQTFVERFSRLLYSLLSRYADGDQDRAGDLFLYVIEKLHEQNDQGETFHRLRRYLESLERYDGQARFSTWLGRVTQNLVSDFFREQQGRRTLPRRIQRLDLTTQRIYKLLYWRYRSEQEAFESVRNQAARLSGTEFDVIVKRINQRLNTCNRWSIFTEIARRTPTQSLDAQPGDCAGRAVVQASDDPVRTCPLSAIISRRERRHVAAASRVLRRILAALPAKSQRLLVYRFKHNLGAGRIAQLLGYRDEKRVYVKLEVLKKRLRRALLREGVNWDSFARDLEGFGSILDEFDRHIDDRVINAFFQPQTACLACA